MNHHDNTPNKTIVNVIMLVATIILTTVCIVITLHLYNNAKENVRNFAKHEEPLVNIEFDHDKKNQPTLLITTDNETLVWREDTAFFTTSNENHDKITYETNKHGYMYNGVIHLTEESIKTYSRLYAETYHKTLRITPKEDISFGDVIPSPLER